MGKSMLNSKSRRACGRKQRQSESGVTILEMVVAMLILTIGLLGLAAAIGYAVTVSNKGRNLTNSKLLVVSLLEQMETLRNTQELKYGQIANVGAVDNTAATRNFAGFPVGFLPLSINPGPDGFRVTWRPDESLYVATILRSDAAVDTSLCVARTNGRKPVKICI